MLRERLDRQLRIEGWNQEALDEAKLAVIGDDDLLASLFILSAAALGVNNIVALSPGFEPRFIESAKQINQELDLTSFEGFFSHPILSDLMAGCHLIVDLSHYGLANKLLLEKGFREGIPVTRGFAFQENGQEGFRAFTYLRGREWQELESLVSPCNVPGDHFDDGVLDIIISGMVLEETKNVLMGRDPSQDLIAYTRTSIAQMRPDASICVVGAGSLGTFVGLGLALAGFKHITFVDPDAVELANLNRQILFGDAVGLKKAEVLARKLNQMFGTVARPLVTYFRSETEVSSYDVVFDCVDNFETRIVLSELCKTRGKLLISGGTSVDAGQVVVYDPRRNTATPAELLGLYDIVDRRSIQAYQRQRASCTYGPDPSVIMTNQIIAGFMVDSFRMVLNGQEPHNIFYNAKDSKRI